jgi:glycosyltransferase involved in cell wall biosynthesis
MPKVSIIVPNYNYARFLDQRLRSIERQTYRDFEVILLDDASSDDSVQVLERFARRHQCRLVCNDDNSGSAFKQWNKGLRLAVGEYIWIAEADDYAADRFLEVMVGRLDQNPRCGVAHCNSVRVDAEGNVMGLVSPISHLMYDVDPDRWQHDFVADGREECVCFLLRENTILNASAVVFRRRLRDCAAEADESLSLAADWKLWVSFLCTSDLAFVAEPLNYFRTHKKSIRSSTPLWTEITENLRVMNHVVDRIDVPRDVLEKLHARLAFVLLHAYITQRPSPPDLLRVRKLTSNLNFGFSTRAAVGFARLCLQAVGRRLSGARRNEAVLRSAK